MLANKTVQLSSRALMLASASARPAATMAAPVVSEWEKGSMVYRDPLEDRDKASYIRATSANGLMTEGLPLTEEASYLSEARVDYMYKSPCDNTSSLQLNSATNFIVENGVHSQPVSVHCATLGSNVPAPANLGGAGLSHLHFKGSSGGLGCKFVSNALLGAHPSRQLHYSASARQQGVQGSGTVILEFEHAQAPANAQGIQGDADSAQARMWVSRCLGDGLYTDCSVPPVDAHGGKQRKTAQQLFVQMLTDIRAAAESAHK